MIIRTNWIKDISIGKLPRRSVKLGDIPRKVEKDSRGQHLGKQRGWCGEKTGIRDK